MFLNYLTKESKEDFLKLCVYASLANDDFAKEEKEMLKEYCSEMNIPEHIPDIEEPLDNILERMQKNTGITEKKIMILEILGLLKADGFYDEQEDAFMKKLIEKWEIGDMVLKQIEGLLDIYTTVCKELYRVILQ